MENERHSKVSAKRHLPDELCREILLKLPVKSLLRFRSVSKSWLSMINDPEFCRVHLKSFKNNRDETHLLVFEDRHYQKGYAVRCSDTFQTNREETFLTIPLKRDEGQCDIYCSIDGLVLLGCFITAITGITNHLMVWNPSIKKFHDIPPLPETETPRGSSFFDVEVGLGYDPLVKDYKHVKFIFVDNETLHSVAIYTLGAGSWKIIQFQGKGCPNWHWRQDYIFISAVYLRGSFYFIATDLIRGVSELVSFDLSSEMFCSFSLPDLISSTEFDQSLAVVGNSLTVLALDWESPSIIWVVESFMTESESMCWTEPCSHKLSLSVSDSEFLSIKKNRDVLMWCCVDDKAVPRRSRHEWDSLSSYNLETREEKILPLQNEYLDDVYGYIESLVLLK